MMPIIESQAQRDALIEQAKCDIHIQEVSMSFCDLEEVAGYKRGIMLSKIALAALEADGQELARKVWSELDRVASPEPFMRTAYESVMRNYTAPVLKPVVLGESQTFPDFPGDEWLWKPGVIKAILESGSTVAGEDNATTE